MKVLHVILILLAIGFLQVCFGGGDGTRPIFTLPGYGLMGLSGFLTVFSFWRSSAKMDRACLLSVACLAFYVFARITFSPVPWLAQFDRDSLLVGLVLYFVTALVVTSSGARLAIVAGLIIFALGHVAVGIFQFAKSPHFHPLLTGSRGDLGFRASGFFISPNHLAGFLVTVLLLATSLCFWGGFRARGKIWFAYFALVCLAGLVLTGSRGGYLSAGAGLVVFAGLSVWTMRTRLAHGLLPRMAGIFLVLAVLGGGLVLAAERSFAIRARASTVFVASDIRLPLWQAAWKQFQFAPAFGTGSRTYVIYGRMFRVPEVSNDPVFAHSDWLQTLAEYGLAGILLILVFIAAHLRHGWQRWARMVRRFSTGMTEPAEKHALALHLGNLSAIAACLVHALIDFNLHIPANFLLAAFLFGMLATRRTLPGEEKSRLPGRVLHALPAALGAWLLCLSVPRIPGERSAEIAREKFAAGKIQEAQRYAGHAIGRGVRQPDLYFQIGEVQRILSGTLEGEARDATLEEAHEAYAQALAIFPQDVGIMLRDAWALGRLERFAEAEALLARAKELDPNSRPVWIFSALHWKFRKMPAPALADFHHAQTFEYGSNPNLLAELREDFDPAEMEKLLREEKVGEPK